MNLRFTICDLSLCLLLAAGCADPQATEPASSVPAVAEQEHQPMEPQIAVPNPQSTIRNPQLPAGYEPAKIGLLPLTELSAPAGGRSGTLSIYLSLLDAFGSQIKAPATMRFELYQYVPRSADAKGQRIAIWPDIDLTAPAENNKYWQDFLRAYEFRLDAQAGREDAYVLQATCICPDGGRRLTAEFVLKTGR